MSSYGIRSRMSWQVNFLEFSCQGHDGVSLETSASHVSLNPASSRHASSSLVISSSTFSYNQSWILSYSAREPLSRALRSLCVMAMKCEGYGNSLSGIFITRASFVYYRRNKISAIPNNMTRIRCKHAFTLSHPFQSCTVNIAKQIPRPKYDMFTVG